ncbi:MAG: hypothetical protein LBS20_14405 [Prevotella sp.]|jgi:uncharacterized protein YciI|nr:hypothetical protein [Prevotella sp.]
MGNTNQNTYADGKSNTVSNLNYDVALAEKLGADDYGMKNYIFVVFKAGANQTTDQLFLNKKYRGHIDKINLLVEQKRIVVAGSIGKNDNNYRGICILSDITTFEEATEVLQTDPAVKAGLLDFELYNWYGSAALPEYLESLDKIWKVRI